MDKLQASVDSLVHCGELGLGQDCQKVCVQLVNARLVQFSEPLGQLVKAHRAFFLRKCNFADNREWRKGLSAILVMGQKATVVQLFQDLIVRHVKDEAEGVTEADLPRLHPLFEEVVAVTQVIEADDLAPRHSFLWHAVNFVVGVAPFLDVLDDAQLPVALHLLRLKFSGVHDVKLQLIHVDPGDETDILLPLCIGLKLAEL